MSPPAQSEEETGTETYERELAAFESFSDEALVYAAGNSPLHLIALHRRYTRLVDAMTAQRALSRQVWLRAFEVLERDPDALLPVADRLTQIAQKVPGEAHIPGERTFLPDPLAWYLHGVLENLPHPLRIVLMLVEIERRPPEEIAIFFASYRLKITASEASAHYGQAQQALVESLPPEVRRFYFDGVLDCLSLTPWLYPDMTEEIRHFEDWQQAQEPAQINAPPPEPQPANQLWWAVPAALGLLVAGGLALQSRQGNLAQPPAPEVSTPPASQQLKPVPVASRLPEVPALPQPPATSALPSQQKVPPAPPWSGRTYLLVAAPELEGFARLRTIDPNIYYRQYQGKPHVQIGVYATRSRAETAGVQVSKLGLKPIYTPTVVP